MRALKVLLETFNIKIDPVEVERAWEQSKEALPRLAKAAEEMNQRQARVEQRQEKIEEKLNEILARIRLLPELEISSVTYDTEGHHAGIDV